jgi:hypothetical protein
MNPVPKKPSIKEWQMYIGRDLHHQERDILIDYNIEKSINKALAKIYEQCKTAEDMYIPMLPEMDGDCLFKSLKMLNIGDTVSSLRKGLAHIMVMYADHPLIPSFGCGLREQYNIFCDVDDEHKFVRCEKDKSYYQYSYDVMCQDLANKHSWSRLPANLILTCISYLFKKKIRIIDGSEHINVINAYESIEDGPELGVITLARINNNHYFPVDKLDDDEVMEPMFYSDAKECYEKWARSMVKTTLARYMDFAADDADYTAPSHVVPATFVTGDELLKAKARANELKKKEETERSLLGLPPLHPESDKVSPPVIPEKPAKEYLGLTKSAATSFSKFASVV